jgi:hypothetical protein
MSIYLPDDGGSKHLWNIGQFLRDYTAQQQRRRSSSHIKHFTRDRNHSYRPPALLCESFPMSAPYHLYKRKQTRTNWLLYNTDIKWLQILWIIIIIIGSTAYVGPGLSQKLLPDKVIQLLLLQISRQVFSGVGLSAPRPTPDYPAGPMFSVRVVSHSWVVPILKRQDLAFLPLHDSRINVAQEPWRGHACKGLGRNKWHYSSLVSIQLSERCMPPRPRTAPLTPKYCECKC